MIARLDGLAIDRQREDCLKIASERGWAVYKEYVDQSKSATDKTKVRPAYDQMVADYEAGRFDAIISYDLDRLTRQPRQLEDWIDAAQEHGLVSVTANGEADLGTNGGRLFARMKAAVARSEVERKSARQSRAHVQRAQQGRAPKGVRPLGYATNGDIIEHEAAAVYEIFRLFSIEDGPSVAAIARGLSGGTGPEVPSSLPHLPKHSRTLAIERNESRKEAGEELKPVPEDGRWHSSTVLGILRNPRYAGYSVYTDRRDRAKNKRQSWHTQILRDENNDPVLGQWTPIVEPEVWWRVQERLNDPRRITNRTGSTARQHIGAGLYLCGLCDKPVITHGTRYRCPDAELIRTRKQVDEWVERVVKARLARPDLQDVRLRVDEPRVKAINADISARKAKLLRVQQDYDNDLIEAFDLNRVRKRENTAIEALEAERRSLMSSTDLDDVLGDDDPVAAYERADLMIKRRVIDFFCTVRLFPHPRGKKTFDPETVQITPKLREGEA
ncbi:recombinase family protein [Blastococcus sp. Marseille-P5729]|uniref:recombinase family protein n=1 Tax=Blastococcus sp. Marseille-P5729 TaxID=2086582 RepID=UPI001F28BAAD|nr:recombinase family protein [Blastococcus sp. Marseille-P5729]